MTTATMAPVYVQGMGGFGDTIYQRPLVRGLADVLGEVWVRTPWPQLYRDLPHVHCVQWEGIALRTQRENQDGQDAGVWSDPPAGATPFRLFYAFRKPGNLHRAMREDAESFLAERGLSLDAPPMDLPAFDVPASVPFDRPVALLRPVTLRKEWLNEARAPDPDYIREAAKLLRREGYHVVSVAHVDHVREWFAGSPPVSDQAFHHGELDAEALMGLVQRASVLVGGIGWIVPAAIAAGTPAVFINGGQGGHNAAEAITDPETMDLRRLRFIEPDEFCRCTDMHHDCPKTITDFPLRFRAAVREVVRCA